MKAKKLGKGYVGYELAIFYCEKCQKYFFSYSEDEKEIKHCPICGLKIVGEEKE